MVSTSAPPEQTVINRLRVRGGGDPGQTRLRLGRLLGTANLHPAGIPPAAVLLVRRLVDPRPGTLPSERMALQVDPAWEAAVRQELAGHYRRAERPRRGIIVGDPDAVVFADETEMLACLALALSKGQGLRQWWWQGVLKNLGAGPDLAAIWQSRPAAVPAILYHLSSWNEAARVIAGLAPAEALALVQSLTRAYELPDLTLTRVTGRPAGRTRDRPPRHRGRLPSGDRDQSSERQGRPRSETQDPGQGWDEQPAPSELAAGTPATPPWAAWLPATAVPADLGPTHSALLGIGLSLHLRPAAVRTAAFWHALRRWWQAPTAISDAMSASAIEPPSPSLTPRSDAPSSPAADGWPVVEEKAPLTIGPHHQREAEIITSAGLQRAGTTKPHFEQGQLPAVAPETGETATPDGELPAEVLGRTPYDPPATRLPDEGLPTYTPEPGAETTLTQELPLDTGAGTVTEAGGVLYLLNLMRALDLPLCFEAGWGLATQLGPWAALELLGRALLGPDGAELASDPLWRLLAELDGRALETLPGADFQAQGHQELPPGWSPGDWHWSPDHSPLLVGINPDLKRWLAMALPSIAQHLQGALHRPDVTRLPETLLLVAGRLYLTPSHLDLVMALDAVSMPVRRAGLDANPGWLPLFGRVVTFHFI